MPILTKSQNDRILYKQMLQHLRVQILDGTYSAGMQLPSEAQLIQDFGVSRGTVRQALKLLADEGLIERIHGSGTFVRQHASANGNGRARKSPSRQIALVLCHSNHQLNMELSMGVDQGVKSRNCQLVVTYAQGDAEQQRQNIMRLIGEGVAGFIVFPLGENPEEEGITHIQDANIPYVLVDRYFPDLDSDWVVADNWMGGYRVTEHLLILGHRRIGFVHPITASSLKVTAIRDRWRGYRDALADYRLPYDENLIFQCPGNATENYNYDPLLLREDRPTAIFAINDYEALTVMRAAYRCRLRAAQDVAIVGFDNLSFGAYVTPSLTTVSQPFVDMGFRAVNILLDRLDGLYMPKQHIELPTHLIVRESCGARLRVQEAFGLE